jgi:hypothetical protein
VHAYLLQQGELRERSRREGRLGPAGPLQVELMEHWHHAGLVVSPAAQRRLVGRLGELIDEVERARASVPT